MTESVPGPTIGVGGGGQLGRMLAEAASPLGVDVIVLDPTPNCPASRVAEQIQGEFDDGNAVRELADRADMLTYEIELADPDLLATVREEFEVPVHPAPETLRTTGDKLREKERLAEAGIPVPEFRPVAGPDDLRDAVEEFGGVMLKARTGGYDGRGNVPVREPDEADSALAEIGAGEPGEASSATGTDAVAVAEEFVDFAREVSVIGVRGDGEADAYPLGENVHEEEILRETIVPARTDDDVRKRARAVAEDVLDVLEGRGVFGIELFETGDGEILVNEIAPRPHNSGHWTIEGAVSSQFEQHVRAVLGWPLGSTALRGPTASANVLGTVESARPAELQGIGEILAASDAHLHWYGKREVRPLRKMGHVTVVGGAPGESGGPADADDSALDDLLAAARDLRNGLTFAREDIATVQGVQGD